MYSLTTLDSHYRSIAQMDATRHEACFGDPACPHPSPWILKRHHDHQFAFKQE